MSVPNPNNNVSKQDLADFYQAIYPYLGGSVQVNTMPTASATFYGKTLQYVGATNANYTHNYFYECVSDGQSTPTYSWQATNVQAGGSGASALADLTDTDIESPTDGQLLGYNNTSGKWENKNAPEADTSKCFKTDDTTETALADADTVPFYDASASGKRRSTWSNIKSVLKNYFDTLYNKYTLPTATSSVLGGIKIGSNMTIENGVINPVLPVVGTINRSDIYDTTEKVIGKWTDGRPLYKKSISFGSLPNTTAKSVNHNISNINEIVKIEAIGKTSSGSYYTIGWADRNTNNNNININVSSTNVSITTSANLSSETISYITITYTKTTDSANSYNYANENDYSTSEKIVGTWIDGSYLYQKTIQTTMPDCTTDGTEASKNVAIGATITNCVFSHVFIKNDNGIVLPMYIVAPPVDTKYARYNIGLNTATDSSMKNSVSLRNANTAWNGKTVYITIQYTK